MIQSINIPIKTGEQLITITKNHHILGIEQRFKGMAYLVFIARPNCMEKEKIKIEMFESGQPMDLSPKSERVYIGHVNWDGIQTFYVFKKING